MNVLVLVISYSPFIQVTGAKLKIKNIGSDMDKIKNMVIGLVSNGLAFDSLSFSLLRLS
jgi:hypothetical protein